MYGKTEAEKEKDKPITRTDKFRGQLMTGVNEVG